MSMPFAETADDLVAPPGFTIARVCDECEETVTEWDDPVYECNDCGLSFTRSETEDSSRCSECGKFSEKRGDGHDGCTGIEEDAKYGLRCARCEEVFETAEQAAEHLVDHADDDSPGKPGRVVLRKGDWFVTEDGAHFYITRRSSLGSRTEGTYESRLSVERFTTEGYYWRTETYKDALLHIEPLAAVDGEWLVLTESVAPLWRGEDAPRHWRVKRSAGLKPGQFGPAPESPATADR